MAASTPTRRSATIVEIKQIARSRLVAGGGQAISLRAIAREMGMTAPAIYRYFNGLEALVLALASDLFIELQATVGAAEAEHAGESPLIRIGHMARAFRRWSLANRAEFGLLFGSPVPGLPPLAALHEPVIEAGARFGEIFFAVLDEHFRDHPAGPEPGVPTEAVEDVLQPFRHTFGDRFPPPVIAHFVSAWTTIHGVVSMEVFGQLRWAMTDVEPLFELELARILRQISG